jgi:hypothetical protein
VITMTESREELVAGLHVAWEEYRSYPRGWDVWPTKDRLDAARFRANAEILRDVDWPAGAICWYQLNPLEMLEAIEDELGWVGRPHLARTADDRLIIVDNEAPADWPYFVASDYSHLFNRAGFDVEEMGPHALELIDKEVE